MDHLNFSFSWEWQPVLLRDKVEYLFPLGITPYMRSKYRTPAVFRWNIYNKTPGDKKMVFLGEAQELCPRRLYGYLNPGPGQQSNQKINTQFRSYIRDGMRISLDICSVKDITFEDPVQAADPLNSRSMRRLILATMIVEHEKKGFTVLDL